MAKFLDEAKIAQFVQNDIHWAREFRQGYTDDWKRYYRLYKNFIDDTSYPWDAKVAIPAAYQTIEVQTAFLSDMVHEAGDFVEVLGKTPQGQASAQAIKKLLNYHFTNSFNIFEDIEKHIRQLLMYGTSIYKVLWKFKPGVKTRKEPRYNEEIQEIEYVDVESPEILDNKPFGYVVDLFNFGVDPNADSVGNARFCFEELWVDGITLLEKQQIGIYKNVEKIIDSMGADSNVNRGLMDRFEEIDTEPFQNSPYVERGKIHIIDYWGYLTKGWRGNKVSRQAKSQLFHVVAAMPGGYGYGTPIILLAEPSPFRHNRIPFVDSRINQCVGEFYGTGDIEYTESLILEQQDLRNIQLDNMTRTMNSMFKILKNTNVDETELVWRPTGTVHVDNMGDLEVLESPTLDPAVFRVQEDIRRDIEATTGVNDFVMGQFRSATGFNDTATGISLIQETALKRVGHKGQIVQRAIRDIGHMTFDLVAQYQPYGTTVRILDRESAIQYKFIEVSEDALQNRYDFHIINAPALGSKPMRQNQMIQLMQILMQSQQHTNMQIDYKAMVKRILEEMDIPNPQEIIGFPDFQQPLPAEAGSPTEGQDFVPPQEENRIMIELHQAVYPKMEEDHASHRVFHREAYDEVSTVDQVAANLLSEHDRAHSDLMEQSRNLLANSLSSQMMVQQAEQQVQQVQQAQQMQNSNTLSSNKTQSPTGAGGREAPTRAAGNMMAGNV